MGDQITGFFSPWLRERRIKRAYPYIRGAVLDYGCGVGTLAELCSGHSYLGVDIDEESITIANRAHPQFRFQQELPETEKFDTIIALAVIEHVADPAALLRKFKLMLKPDGHIVLTTPHPFFRKVHDCGSKIGLFSPDSDEHKQFIDRRLMREMVAQAGLSIKIYRRFLLGANQLFVLK